jgi:LPXTG-motif cell wall-anchored protein
VAAAPEMPKTATWLPLAGTLGLILLALGAGISLLRRRGRA